MHTNRIAPPSFAPLLLTLVSLAGALAGCGRDHRPADLDAGERTARTYAWADLTSGGEGARIDDPALEAELRAELEARLAVAGYERVPGESASLALGLRLGVERRTRTNDPTWAFYTQERLEVGHVTLGAFRLEDDESLWSRSVEVTLRVTERGFGHSSLQWTGTEAQRDWRVPRTARQLTRSLP